MKINHRYFSQLALNLAEIHLGKTNPNPSVGCIVVKNNSVISSGITSIKGRPHAETNALNKKINFSGSHMYVTLEPCTHYGLTPPCVNIIKKKKIKKIYFNYDDPDLRTYQKAKKFFLKKKINFKKVKIIKNDFYKSYFFNYKEKLPYFDAKIAISKDFKTINKKSKRITNYRSEKVTHLIRSKYDSIITTSKTINEDDAILNIRIDGLNRFSPDLLIIDRKLKLKTNLKLFKIANKRKTYIFTSSKNKRKISFFRKKNCHIIRMSDLYDKNSFLNLFKTIYKLGKRRVLVESGLTFLTKLLKFKLVDTLYVFKSDKSLINQGFNNISSKFLNNFKLNDEIKVNLKNDKLFKVKV